MSETLIMAAVRAVDWADGTVPPAFEHLLGATSERTARDAYNNMLNAVAHNHSGEVRDAAVPAAPLLADIVARTDGWPRWAAIEVLIELLSWAGPAHADAIHAAVDGIRETLTELAPTDPSARELLDVLAQ